MKFLKTLTLVFCSLFAGSRLQAETLSEVHLRLCPTRSARTVVSNLDFEPEDEENFDAWFLDTKELALNDHGMVFRIRDFANRSDKVTLKFLRLPHWNLGDDWWNLDDFKCEVDVFGERQKESCSLDSKSRTIADVLAGRRNPDSLLSADQKRFLAQFAPINVQNFELLLLGPVPVAKWSNDADQDLEIWKLPNGAFDTELSQKVRSHDVAATGRRLQTQARMAGVSVCTHQGSKTREALVQFVRAN